MSLWLAAAVSTALAAEIDLRQLKSTGTGAQSITVVLTEVPGPVRPRIVLESQNISLDPAPIGEGMWAGTIKAEPRRFAHLTVLDTGVTPPESLYSGLVTLPDQDHEILAYKYRTWLFNKDQRREMLRVPLVPYTRIGMGMNENVWIHTAGAWAALGLAYATAMAALSLLRRRVERP